MTLPEHVIAKEVDDIQATALWPMWPILPMKKINGEREVGVLIDGRLTTVYLKNLWTFESGKQLGPQLEGVPTQTYESVEDMVRDGWIGD